MSSKVEGVGLGLRIAMADAFLDAPPERVEKVRWLEVHPENYLRRGGRYTTLLAKARERWPLVTHGLSMCFGQTTPFEREFLTDLRAFLADLDVPWHSDHMCFGGAHGVFVHDLLPLPFTEEAVDTVGARYREARDTIDRELAIENVSYYAPQPGDPLDEARFIAEVVARSGAKLLLDVNNVFVNSRNHGFDPKEFLKLLPSEAVVQIHVAGHRIKDPGDPATGRPELRIDTHGEAVCDEVYDLLDWTLRRIGPRPVLLERDNDVPPLDVLLDEVDRLDRIVREAARAEAAE